MGNIKKVIIIGGGASGMVAAISASRNGAKAIIIEQLNRVGKKILATGNGRCNITNSCINIDRYHGRSPEFIHGALNQFSKDDTIDFFTDLGLSFYEEDGKLYPASLQSSSVIDVLRYEMRDLGIEEVCDSRVKSISALDSGFEIKMVDGRKIFGNKVIVATGGKANPGLGSNGSGYKLVKPFGHKIVEPFPALVQLKLDEKFLKSLAGVKFFGEAALRSDDKVLRRERGEILFTSYGISGPPIIQLSRCVGEQLNLGDEPCLTVNMFPGKDYEEVLNLLIRRNNLREDKPLNYSFIGLINKKLINVLLKESGIEKIDMPCSTVRIDELKAIADKMVGWSFVVKGTQSWSDAQVTAGGVDVSHVSPETMESKLIPGIYFAGEILDIDGDCGGFNLQWAWSSGYVAGFHASLF